MPATLVDQNKEMGAMLVDQGNPCGIELHSCANNSFYFIESIDDCLPVSVSILLL